MAAILKINIMHCTISTRTMVQKVHMTLPTK